MNFLPVPLLLAPPAILPVTRSDIIYEKPKLELMVEQVGKTSGKKATLRFTLINRRSGSIYISRDVSTYLKVKFTDQKGKVLRHDKDLLVSWVRDEAPGWSITFLPLAHGRFWGFEREFVFERPAKGIRVQATYDYPVLPAEKQPKPSGEEPISMFSGKLEVRPFDLK